MARLNELKVKWEAAAEDRERASYSETIEVHQMFHSKIIGQKGATINKLNDLHNARVNFPSSRSKELELADVSPPLFEKTNDFIFYSKSGTRKGSPELTVNQP